jgi:hypothetical protein
MVVILPLDEPKQDGLVTVSLVIVNKAGFLRVSGAETVAEQPIPSVTVSL